MDFSKLNLEFANMQKTVEDYNKIITLINMRIKDNLRTVSKYETKMKNTKNKLEKDLAHLYITSIKCETEFLESLSTKNRLIYNTEFNLAKTDDKEIIDRYAEQYFNGENYTKDDLDNGVSLGDLIYVESYKRSDGTEVSGYYRRK